MKKDKKLIDLSSKGRQAGTNSPHCGKPMKILSNIRKVLLKCPSECKQICNSIIDEMTIARREMRWK